MQNPKEAVATICCRAISLPDQRAVSQGAARALVGTLRLPDRAKSSACSGPLEPACLRRSPDSIRGQSLLIFLSGQMEPLPFCLEQQVCGCQPAFRKGLATRGCEQDYSTDRR